MPKKGTHYNLRSRVTTQVQDEHGTRTVDTTTVLDVDLDSLIRQLTAAALVSEAHPKVASRVQGAVVLTITEEEATNL